mmetsp:Transcript_86629/g.241093  ORF Transcript_86629/g.241093 Transcript_86629/m.241093 type:complete len:232 (+) Transcript_86629:20-715(+)
MSAKSVLGALACAQGHGGRAGNACRGAAQQATARELAAWDSATIAAGDAATSAETGMGSGEAPMPPRRTCRRRSSSSRRSFSASAPTSTWPQTSCSTSCRFDVPSSLRISTAPKPPSSMTSSLLTSAPPVSISSTTCTSVRRLHSQRSLLRISDSTSRSSRSICSKAWETTAEVSGSRSVRSCSTLMQSFPKRKVCTVSSACVFSPLQHTTKAVRAWPLSAGSSSWVSLES